MVYTSCFMSCQTTKDLGSYKIGKIKKFSNLQDDSLVSSVPAKMKILLILPKNSWKTEIKILGCAVFCMKSRVCLKYFVNDCGPLLSQS